MYNTQASTVSVFQGKYFASIYTYFKFQQFNFYISNQNFKSHRAYFRRKEIFQSKSSLELGKDDQSWDKSTTWYLQKGCEFYGTVRPVCHYVKIIHGRLNKRFLNLNLQRKAIATRFLGSICDTRGLCLTMPVEIGDQNGLSINLSQSAWRELVDRGLGPRCLCRGVHRCQ
jgi:hypothetical protein